MPSGVLHMEREHRARGWHIHLPPWRKSRSWLEEGSSEGALIYVLQYAWKKYLIDQEELTIQDCPIKKLFPANGEVPANILD